MSESPNDLGSISPQEGTVIPSVLAADSGESETDGETESLEARISDYVHENGRTYHRFKEGSYPFPNDARELERLDSQYDILKTVTRGRVHFAPIRNPTAMLDIGTGTGRWAIEMGELFPDAMVTGTDLAPIQHLEVTENVYFDIEDCNEEVWARDAESFDLIHTSIMLGSLESFRQLIQTAYQYLKPETGWIECWEVDPTPRCDDGTLAKDCAFQEWQDLLHEAAEERVDPPRPLRYAHRIATYMRSAGYVDVEELKYKIPVNSWPSDPAFKELGRRWSDNLLEGLSGFSYKLFGQDGLGWSRHEIEVFLAHVRKSVKDRNMHAYQNFHVVWGRRPSKAEEPGIQQRLAQRKLERQERKRASQAEADS